MKRHFRQGFFIRVRHDGMVMGMPPTLTELRETLAPFSERVTLPIHYRGLDTFDAPGRYWEGEHWGHNAS